VANQHLHPESSPLFTPWVDPASGVRSWILTERAAPWQQSFYFTNNPITDDGRWLWLYSSYPPSPHVLGVVDLAEQTVAAFADTAFEAESPWVDPSTGEVFWAHPGGVFRRRPGPGQPVVEVATLDDTVTGGRDVRRLSTHLTRSADGELLNVDLWAGNRWHVGVVHLDSGLLDVWFSADRRFQHSQFHPTEPRRLLLAQDYWHDDATGERQHWQNRIWVLDEGVDPVPLFPDDDERVQVQFHEWWSADGVGVFYVDVGWGTGYVDLAADAERRTVWPGGTCHSHASVDGALLVGDINTYRWDAEPVRVAFYDTANGRETNIVSDWPAPPARASMGYHPDPHPRFILDDEFVVYTTTVLGGLDLALTRVDELVAGA
jgi:hypothetical protein